MRDKHIFRCRFINRLATIKKLGWYNIFYYLLYLTIRFFKIGKAFQHPRVNQLYHIFNYQKKYLKPIKAKIIPRYFKGYYVSDCINDDWLENVFNGKKGNRFKAWWEINDFDSTIGDIKGIWEKSRMNWVLVEAVNFLNNHDDSLEKINLGINQWIKINQPYYGPNWKCGQEAAFRVLNVCLAFFILQKSKSINKDFRNFLIIHLNRISTTIFYAIAQQNNHATSEAAALYVGGIILEHNNCSLGKKWKKKGRKLLEKLSKKLINSSGGFSQYSTNYHRLMLDTYSVCEIFRTHFGDIPFDANLYNKAQKATNWLLNLIHIDTGRVPNLGANDGSHLLNFGINMYSDFRQSINVASNLFYSKNTFKDKSSNYLIKLLRLPKYKESKLQNNFFEDKEGGVIANRTKNSFLLFRFPNFLFRPSQSDCMHIDFWLKKYNILRDGGTYLYNPINPKDFEYFKGSSSHNTVEFDSMDQMPILGRFLYGSWLKYSEYYVSKTNKKTIFKCSYIDYKGNQHKRIIEHSINKLHIIDIIKDFKNTAVLRWRLLPGCWKILEQNDKLIIIQLNKKMIFLRLKVTGYKMQSKINKGYESINYSYKNEIPILEILVKKPGLLKTTLEWDFL